MWNPTQSSLTKHQTLYLLQATRFRHYLLQKKTILHFDSGVNNLHVDMFAYLLVEFCCGKYASFMVVLRPNIPLIETHNKKILRPLFVM